MGYFRARLYVAEVAQEVDAEDFAAVFVRVAAAHELRGDFRQVGSGVDPFGQRGNAVKVRAEADVLDAGNSDDVLDVIDEIAEWWTRDSGGPFAIQCSDAVVGDGDTLRLPLGDLP